mmetsp:Transcript_42080/g.116244  ORF Transcript_42080/g.116244 Transcript_42080/m.116244 type:complete len:211 (-) Transcript_42080:1179-1811(-)
MRGARRQGRPRVVRSVAASSLTPLSSCAAMTFVWAVPAKRCGRRGRHRGARSVACFAAASQNCAKRPPTPCPAMSVAASPGARSMPLPPAATAHSNRSRATRSRRRSRRRRRSGSIAHSLSPSPGGTPMVAAPTVLRGTTPDSSPSGPWEAVLAPSVEPPSTTASLETPALGCPHRGPWVWARSARRTPLAAPAPVRRPVVQQTLPRAVG